jgi:hypothetical protein
MHMIDASENATIQLALLHSLRAILRQKIEAGVVAQHTPYAPIFHELAQHYASRGDAAAAEQARWQHWLFALQPATRDERGSHGDRFTGLVGNSTGRSFLDFTAFPPEAYDLFRRELVAASHAILRARYADFLWQYGGGDHRVARQAVRAYLDAAAFYASAGRRRRITDALDRAADLAMRLRDDQLIGEAKRLAFTIAAQLLDGQDAGCPPAAQDPLRVFQSFNSGGPQARLTDAEQMQIVTLADRGAGFYAAHGEYEFERWFLKIMQQAYRSLARLDDVHVVERRLAQSYEADAAARPRFLDRLYSLEQAHVHYLACGDRAKADKMKRLRQHAAVAGEAEMGTVSMEFELPAAEMQQLADRLMTLEAVAALRALSEFETCVPSVQAARDRASAESEQFPMLGAMAWVTLNKGRITNVAGTEAARAQVGELRAYQFGRLAGDALLHLVLTRLRAEKGLDTDMVMAFLRTGGLFDTATLATVVSGVERYFSGDYVSAIHVLVPQLEDALRGILRRAGLPTQVQNEDGTTQEMALGQVLAHPLLKRGLGEDIWHYLEGVGK